MSRIFGISDLPVSKPFPSLEFGKNNYVERPAEYIKKAISNADIYLKDNIPKKRFLKQFFSRVKH